MTRAMLRAIFLSVFIVAAAIPLCAFLGGVAAGRDGAGLGALLGALIGMTVASRFLLDSLAIAAARSEPATALDAAERADRMRRQPHLIRSRWAFARFLRQDEEERRRIKRSSAVKRLYSQQHHDLDIRDIPGAAHLARKRKRKR